MDIEMYVKETYLVGNDTVVEDYSEKFNNYHVVFEDDTETGYFYALDLNFNNKIQDAVHIYNVKDVVDKNLPSKIVIAWSKDGLKSILFINEFPHAIIDFETKNCYCRTGFPPNDEKSKWSLNGHEWNEEIYEKIIGK